MRIGTVKSIWLANTLTVEGTFNLEAGYLTVEKIDKDKWMAMHRNYSDNIKGFYKVGETLTESEVMDLLIDESQINL